jgi:hypothetical protein
MAYIGLRPVTNFLSTFSQKFSGDGTTIQFILSRAVTRAEDLEVFVGDTQILPGAYTANGNELTFVSAPAAGTDNITVIFRAGAIQSVEIGSTGFPAGSAASPGVFFADGVNTGLFWPSVSSIAVSTLGVTRVEISSATDATSTTTGALQVTGGVGATGNLFAGGIVRLTDETESSGVATGAVVISGGVGIAKNLNVNGDIQVTGDFTVAGTFTTTASDSLAINDPFLFLATNNTGDALDTGFVSKYVDGALVNRFTGFFRDVTDGVYKVFANLTVEPSTTVDTNAPSFNFADFAAKDISAAGTIQALGGADATSTTTGALRVTGGVGITGAIYATSLDLSSGNIATTGFLSNVAGINASGVVRTTGILYANSGVATSSTTTGALVVNGGVGITGNVTAGNVAATTFVGAVIGNASTATTLQTTRAINGTNFNGSAAITTANWGTARNITIGSTTRSVNGSTTYSWTLADIGVNDSTLTLATSGIATGSQTWTSNQGTNATFTVNVPATNLGITAGTTAGPVVTSSTGTNATLPTASGTASGVVTTGAQTWAGVKTLSSAPVVPSITKSGTNGVGNIGQSNNSFDTVFAKATSAQYADVAERYLSDADYEPGTVMHFGGEYEVSQCDSDSCTRVAGVVSTNPAYIMNSQLEGDHVVSLALLGRVPCKVEGAVQRGDMMVSAGNGRARAEDNPRLGTVIGKALEDFDGDVGVIEVVVGRN